MDISKQMAILPLRQEVISKKANELKRANLNAPLEKYRKDKDLVFGKGEAKLEYKY